ncbi:hypothetical protein BLNAU_7405 [Blattamonas nauphoetae]|uniref:Uncharacterized protein n=1 Tax=Blattamonas nauphoetae TaxID=2049346 RepID=A0ABQ9Y189_9EUKA|nr:hypothetical protein BLNAU_7405 [Blattamonas nauphoetae]
MSHPDLFIHRLSFALTDWIATAMKSAHFGESDQSILELNPSIAEFLTTCAKLDELTEAELLYTGCLIETAILTQLHSDPQRFALLKEDNIGIFILSSIIITLKCLRDETHPNSSWADAFHIDLAAINSAERLILKCLQYHANVSVQKVGNLQLRLGFTK